MEKITGSAIQFGEIFVSMLPPHRHHHVYRQAEKMQMGVRRWS